jgi:hypothetical protein
VTLRGKKSHTTIAGHTLTWAELTVLRQLQNFLRAIDGRSVRLHEIFPNIAGNPKRHCARRLASLGVLQACQIEFENDTLKGKL